MVPWWEISQICFYISLDCLGFLLSDLAWQRGVLKDHWLWEGMAGGTGHSSAELHWWLSCNCSTGAWLWWKYVQSCTLPNLSLQSLNQLICGMLTALLLAHNLYSTVQLLGLVYLWCWLDCQDFPYYMKSTLLAGCNICCSGNRAAGSMVGFLGSAKTCPLERWKSRCWNCHICEMGNPHCWLCNATSGPFHLSTLPFVLRQCFVSPICRLLW